MTAKSNKPKSNKNKELTKKQKDFADEYIKTGNRTKAARKVYNVKNDNMAAVIGSTNIRKDNIIQYLRDNSDLAASYMTSVINNTKDKTSDRINAAKDVMDRAGYKPKDKIEYSGEMNLNRKDMSIDEIEEVMRKFTSVK